VFFLSQKQTFSEKKKVFAGFGVSFCPKNKRSLKKKVFAGLEAFFYPKNGPEYKSQGGKSRPGGAKISPGGEAAPLLPAPMLCFLLNKNETSSIFDSTLQVLLQKFFIQISLIEESIMFIL